MEMWRARTIYSQWRKAVCAFLLGVLSRAPPPSVHLFLLVAFFEGSRKEGMGAEGQERN